LALINLQRTARESTLGLGHQRQRFANLRPDSFRDRSDKTIGSIAYPGKDSDKQYVGPLVGVRRLVADRVTDTRNQLNRISADLYVGGRVRAHCQITLEDFTVGVAGKRDQTNRQALRHFVVGEMTRTVFEQ
jgi:hypothetical protein